MPKPILSPSAHNFIDLTDKRFGKLVVIKLIGRTRYRQIIWLCRCDCGKERTVHGSNLRSGATKSCGHHGKGPSLRHGHTARGKTSPEYITWQAMKTRCENPNSVGWQYYGGRGISVCKRWSESFQAFFDDIGPRPGAIYSIDRLAPDGNYEPSNCRWATPTEQANNRRQRHKNTRRQARSNQHTTARP